MATLLAMLVCVPAAAAAGQEPLRGEWHLDETCANPCDHADTSGNGLTAHAHGMPTHIADGRFAGALDFPSKADYLDAGDSPLLQPPKVSLVAWVRKSGTPGTVQAVAAQGASGSCSHASYALYTGGSLDSPGLRFYIWNGSQVAVSPAADNAMWDGHWHMVAGTYDGATVRLYVDGTQVGSGTPASGNIAYGLSASNDFIIGNSVDPDCVENTDFSGDVDETRVYSRALSASEVQTLSDPSATTPPELPPDSRQPPVHLKVNVTRFQKSPALNGITIDTLGTTGASRIGIDMNSDRKLEYNGNASLPVVDVVTPTPSSAPITVEAIAPDGQVSSQTIRPTLPGLRMSPDALNHSVVGDLFVARPTNSPLLNEVGKACTPSEVVEGIIDARGCFVQAFPADLPHPLSDVVARYYKKPVVPDWVDGFCQTEHQLGHDDLCQIVRDIYKAQPVYVGQRTVELNGLTIRPAPGTPVMIYPDQARVVAPSAVVTLGSIPIKAGEIDIDLTDLQIRDIFSNSVFHVTKTAFELNARDALQQIGGFPIDAGGELSFGIVDGARESVVSLHVGLPAEFDVFGGGDQPSAEANAYVTNDRPLHVSTIDVTFPHASLGGLGFDDVGFHYNEAGNAQPHCQDHWWKATARIELGEGINGQPPPGFDLHPPPDENGIAFCQGSFDSAGAQLNFGCPLLCPPELFPGVFLTQIGAAIGLDPVVVRGHFQVAAADYYTVDGQGFMTLARPDAPYYLSRDDAGPELVDLAPRTFTSTTLAAGGAVGINTPLGHIRLGGIGFMYSFPDYAAVAGGVDIILGYFHLRGHLAGDLNTSDRTFDMQVDGDACIDGIEDGACLGGSGHLSSNGIVACLDLPNPVSFFGGDSEIHPGAGVHFDGEPPDFWLVDGCKQSPYWVAVRGRTASVRASAATSYTFRVARGEHVKNLTLMGAGGAPSVLVRGPGGASLAVTGSRAVGSGHLLGLRSDRFQRTWLGVSNGQPGTYTITPLAGSVPFSTLLETRPGYDTNFRARVTGHGDRRVLHYDARKRGGHVVTFFEKGRNVWHRLLTSRGGRGSVHFHPAPGPGGTRTIVAQATVNGTPIAEQVLARFHFAGTRPASRPAHVRVHRHGRTLEITWTRVPGATRYGVVVDRGGSGGQKVFTVSARRLSLRVRGYPRFDGGRVSVYARGVLGDWSKARYSKRFGRVQAPPTVFRKRLHKHHRR